jgi:hypothetical protein
MNERDSAADLLILKGGKQHWLPSFSDVRLEGAHLLLTDPQYDWRATLRYFP